MDFGLLIDRINATSNRIIEIGGKVRELVIDEPAREIDILKVEEELGSRLPYSFRKAILEFSSNFSFRWFLPDEYSLPDNLRGIFGGTPHLGLDLTVDLDKERKEWVENVFFNPHDPYDRVWHNKLAFLSVGNGDYIAFDLNGDEDPPVVYLSHDDGTGHGYILGNNYIDFLNRWSRLAFVGGEDWQWLPFVANKQDGLNPNSENAEEFRNSLGLKI